LAPVSRGNRYLASQVSPATRLSRGGQVQARCGRHDVILCRSERLWPIFRDDRGKRTGW